MEPDHLQLVVLVKAAPVLTRHLDETMCVAGARLDASGAPAWVRLHPVPFRDLAVEHQFAKYQAVRARVRRPTSDRRPESWSPIEGTIELGESLGTADGWAARRHLVDQLDERSMCELVEANEGGSGPFAPSLAVVRPIEPPRLVISERDVEQLAEWHRRADANAARRSLFDDLEVPRSPFEVVPWRFRYHYRCDAHGCRGHKQTIVDWEVLALYRRVQHRPNWQELMTARFQDEMWKGRDTVLFVGNQEQYPTGFLILGVFWPPAGPVQTVLEL